MKIPTTLDRKTWKKWLICPTLAVLLALTVLPVYASESQAEPTEEIIAEEDAGSESAQESAASGEQQETDWEEQSSEQQDTVPEDLSSEQQETVSEESVVDPQEEISENLVIEQQMDAADPAAVATAELTEDLPYEGKVLNGGYVGFKNKASGKYLTISGGSITAGTNVFQSSQSSISNSQEFYLSYSHDHKKNFSYFTIYPVNTSGNAASTRVKSNSINASTGTANVGLSYFMPTEMTDRWQIEHYEGNYFIIHISSRPYESGARYVLTAQAGEGSATGTGIYDAGNVYVTTYNGANAPSASMLWEICADGDPMNIYANDITQSTGEVIVGIGDSIEYYYVPKAFNNSIDWVVNGSADLTAPGTAATNDFGTAQVSVKVNSIVEESAYLRMMPPNGECYYLQNAASKLYVNVENNSTSAGAYIEQNDASMFYTGRWQVVHDNNNPGYVRFRSSECNYYIGVIATDPLKVILTSDLSDCTLWKIDTCNDKQKRIVSKLFETSNKVLNLPYNNLTSEKNLVVSSYLNDADYRDEWIFWRVRYTYSVMHYYDKGHEARFGTSEADIKSYQNVVSEILLQQFGVATLYSVYDYVSCADTCTGTPVTLSDTTSDCSHLVNEKTRLAIRTDLVLQFGAGMNRLTRVAWTGHVLEDRASNSDSLTHTVVMTIGDVIDALGNNLSEAQVKSRYTYILLHELSHQLGAPDHYCYDTSARNCNNPTNDCHRCDHNGAPAPDCVMSDWDNTLESNIMQGNYEGLYCPQCKSSVHEKGILTHLEDHH